MYMDITNVLAEETLVFNRNTGQQIHDCFAADDKTGFYRIRKRNGEGNFYIDSSKTQVVSETLRGNIKIRMKTKKGE